MNLKGNLDLRSVEWTKKLKWWHVTLFSCSGSEVKIERDFYWNEPSQMSIQTQMHSGVAKIMKSLDAGSFRSVVLITGFPSLWCVQLILENPC